jgi:hypothetical protein
VQEHDAAARGAAEEAEEELGHDPFIGSRACLLKLDRGVRPGRPRLGSLPRLELDRVSPIFRRHGRPGRSTIPPAGVLRRERRALLQLREERLRDLGGLLLEMFRRDRFREDLVRDRCEELLEIDDHLAALDSLLGLAWTVPDQARCTCGAPIADDARFCPACGRSLGDSSRVCAACGGALPADASFCSRCGMRSDARAVRRAEPAAEMEPEAPAPVAELTEG